MPSARRVLDSAEVSRILSRVAFELLEKGGDGDMLLLGIPTRGVFLAERLAERLLRIEPDLGPNLCGTLDVTRFRDDIDPHQPLREDRTSLPDSIDGRTVVLVDDVLYSGRTVRAAFDALTKLGRPAVVRLVVLVDRGHREFPIRPDHVGKNLPTAHDERVRVRLTETDGVDEVVIERGVA